ncbi:MAG: PAS domain S-box protein [Archaeoglobaceae archaeon]
MQLQPERILSSEEGLDRSCQSSKGDLVEFVKDGKIYVYSLENICESIRNLYSEFWDSEVGYVFTLGSKIFLANKKSTKIFGNIEGRDFREVFGFEVSEGRKLAGNLLIMCRKISTIPEIFEVSLIDLGLNLEYLMSKADMYRMVVENSFDVILQIDINRKITYANPAVRLFGYSQEQLIGKNIYDFIDPSCHEKVSKSIENSIETSKPKRIEIEIRDAKGNNRVVEVVVSVVRNSKGEVSGGVLVLRDVTERTALLEKLKRTTKLYETLLEFSPEFIVLVDLNGKIIYANKAFREIARDYENKKIYDYVSEEELEKVTNLLSYALETGEPFRDIFRVKIDEREMVLEVSGKFAYDELGRPLYAVIITRDISERVKLESKLNEREELYKTLAELSHTIILIVQDNKIVYANKRAEEVLGYTADDVNKLEHPYNIVHPEHRDFVKIMLQKRLAGEKVPESYEIKILAKDGSVKWMKVLAKLIDFRGKPAIFANLADITDIKENEERLKNFVELLKVANSVSRIISTEKSEFGLLTKPAKIFEKIGKVAVFSGDALTPIRISAEMNLKKAYEVAKVSLEYKKISTAINDKFYVAIPVLGKSPNVMVIESERSFDDEEIGLFDTISKDMSIAMKALFDEKIRENVLKVIMQNLEHFESLADKLRNPLAIIMGLLEVREEVNFERILNEIEAQATKIEKILDELRMREILTYEMKKMLEGS